MEIKEGMLVAFRIMGSSVGIIKGKEGNGWTVDDGTELYCVSGGNVVPLLQLWGADQKLSPEAALSKHFPEVFANLAMMLAQKPTNK